MLSDAFRRQIDGADTRTWPESSSSFGGGFGLTYAGDSYSRET